jgi:hypothetical protein
MMAIVNFRVQNLCDFKLGISANFDWWWGWLFMLGDGVRNRGF